MILVLLGAPGVGKGTQADLLLSHYKSCHKLSTGDLLRKEVKDKTALGNNVKEVLAAGNLVSDEILAKIITKYLKPIPVDHLVVLDGYPRNLEQAKALEGVSGDHVLVGVVHIEVQEQALIGRLTGRLTCQDCGATYHTNTPPKVEGICERCGGKLQTRSDDIESKVLNRLKIYKSETQPVVDFYRQLGLYACVDGSKSVENVNAEIISKVDSMKGKQV